MEKSPAYQVYPKDMQTDDKYLLMNWEQRGIYRHLLDLQWLAGQKGLPKDPVELSKMISYPGKKFAAYVWNAIEVCFPVDCDGRRRNSKLESIRKKQKEFHLAKSRAGKLGNKTRWDKDLQKNKVQSHSNLTAIATDITKNRFPSASPSSSAFNKDKSRFDPDDEKATVLKITGLTDHQNQFVINSIAQTMGYVPESEACQIAFRDLAGRIEKRRSRIKDLYAYAIKSARELKRDIEKESIHA